jgi:hypothetical protein
VSRLKVGLGGYIKTLEGAWPHNLPILLDGAQALFSKAGGMGGIGPTEDSTGA